MKSVFGAYADYVTSRSTYNQVLAEQMEKLARNVISSYQYNLHDALDLVKALKPADKDENGKKIKSNGRRTALNEMCDRLEDFVETSNFRLENPLKHVDMNNPSTAVSDDEVVRYAGFLFDKAKKNQNIEIRMADLYGLLTRSGSMNKQLLSDVVEVYGETYTADEMNNSQYNALFHDKMTKMLQHVVTEYDYTDNEVSDLTHRISKGAEGTYEIAINDSERDMEEYGVEAAYSEKRGHEIFRNMAMIVRNTYAPVHDREDRYKSSDSKTISPIVLRKISGGNTK